MSGAIVGTGIDVGAVAGAGRTLALMSLGLVALVPFATAGAEAVAGATCVCMVALALVPVRLGLLVLRHTPYSAMYAWFTIVHTLHVHASSRPGE